MEKIKSYIPVIIVVIVALVLVVGSAVYMGKTSSKSARLSSDEVGAKVIGFINDDILKGQATAELTFIVEENDLYKIKFEIQGQEIESYVTMDGKLFFPEAMSLESSTSETATETGSTIGDFSVSSDPLLTENDKPVVYFFGSESCPHCVWEKPIIEAVMAKFKDQVSFHENIDNEEDMDVFNKYSDGGIPTLILAGKYYRVGSGEQSGEEAEAQNLTALVCKLTNNEPKEACDAVADIISQIEE